MKTSLYLLLFVFSLQSFGQNMQFNKLYDENDLWQGTAAVIETPNQNYLLSGLNIGFSWNDFYLHNYIVNYEGEIINYAKVVSQDTLNYYYVGFQSLFRTNIGYLLAGTQEEYVNQIQKDDGYLMKIDEEGNKVWQKNYGGYNFDGFDAMILKNAHELVLAGVSHSFGDSSWGNIYIVKTDTAGELIWQKSLGINNFPERCWSIDTTSDGGYVLAGIQGFDSQENVFVIKIDSLGNQKWKKNFGSAIGNNILPRIRSLLNGDFLLTTALKTSVNSLTKAYITRLSPTGSKIWQRYYPGEEWNSWFGFATELSDGTLVNAGGLMEYDSASVNYWVRGTLTKTDAQGNLMWQRKYFTTQYDNYFFAMIPTSDAGFLMGGFAYRPGNNRQDAWAVKVDSLGCLEPGCTGSVAAPEPGAAIGLRLYPNPASSWLIVESPEEPMLGLRLTNPDGRTVEDVQFFRQYPVRDYRLSLATLPPGTYVLSVRTDKGWVSEKIIKQ